MTFLTYLRRRQPRRKFRGFGHGDLVPFRGAFGGQDEPLALSMQCIRVWNVMIDGMGERHERKDLPWTFKSSRKNRPMRGATLNRC
jgi:hypothetical protein